MEYILTQLAQLFDLSVLALAVMSFILGIVVMLLDSILFAVRGSSLLKIPHKGTFIADVPIILLWSLGSAIVGFLGGICKIFNPQGLLQTSVLIAIAWPIILRNLVAVQSSAAGSTPQDNKE